MILGSFNIVPTVPVSEDFFIHCYDSEMIKLLIEAHETGCLIKVVEIPVYIATVSFLADQEGIPVEFLCRYLPSEDRIRVPRNRH